MLRRLIKGSALLISALVVVVTPITAYADFYSDNDILFYDPNAAVSTCTATSTTGQRTAQVPTNFSLGKNAQDRRVNLMKALIADYGFTPAQAAGIVGNFMQESGGAHLPPDVNEGGHAGPPRFSGGYGWAQWTGSRQTSFINFAVSKGYMSSRSDRATDAANYAYLRHELDTGYKSTITDLKKQQTPERAAFSFHATFEKSADSFAQIGERGTSASQALKEYNGGGGGPGTSTSSSDCGGQNGAAAIVGDVAFPLITTKKQIDSANPGMFKNNDTSQGGHPYIAYDILAKPGTPVVAFMSGTVSRISSDRCPGRLITIYNKENDVAVSYMHLSFSNHVQEGKQVKPGDRVGLVGAAQNGCGVAHLHIDAIKGNIRYGCSRLGCAADIKAMFVNIGPQLYKTYEQLP